MIFDAIKLPPFFRRRGSSGGHEVAWGILDQVPFPPPIKCRELLALDQICHGLSLDIKPRSRFTRSTVNVMSLRIPLPVSL